jgi:hypothetical protein
MIKVVNLVSLIIAPIIVVYKNLGLGGWGIVLLLVIVLVWAIRQSKKHAPSLKELGTAPSVGD